jgi:hypothetical protein
MKLRHDEAVQICLTELSQPEYVNPEARASLYKELSQKQQKVSKIRL